MMKFDYLFIEYIKLDVELEKVFIIDSCIELFWQIVDSEIVC